MIRNREEEFSRAKKERIVRGNIELMPASIAFGSKDAESETASVIATQNGIPISFDSRSIDR
jgi:hypothetical protein